METLLQIYPEDILSSVRSPEFLEKFSREEYQFGIFGLISSRITEYTKNCKWHNEKIPCNANFRPIITEEGKCFSFVRFFVCIFELNTFITNNFLRFTKIDPFFLCYFQNLLSSYEIFTPRWVIQIDIFCSFCSLFSAVGCWIWQWHTKFVHLKGKMNIVISNGKKTIWREILKTENFKQIRLSSFNIASALFMSWKSLSAIRRLSVDTFQCTWHWYFTISHDRIPFLDVLKNVKKNVN